MSNGHQHNVAQTYLALRLGMVLLVGLLFLSIAALFASTNCLQRSISAYYYTATRPIFVATLCAIGAILIVYRGNTDTENVILDFCGFLAFIVAFVPTKIDTSCVPSNVPSTQELAAAIRNNVPMMFVIGFLSIFGWLLWSRPQLSNYAKRSLAISASTLLAGLVFFIGWTDTFQRIGHYVSAIVFFLGIVAVVIVNAEGFARKSGAQRWVTNPYAIVAGAMVVSAASIYGIHLVNESFNHWVFLLEFTLIFEFAVFWMLQTRELGGKATR